MGIIIGLLLLAIFGGMAIALCAGILKLYYRVNGMPEKAAKVDKFFGVKGRY